MWLGGAAWKLGVAVVLALSLVATSAAAEYRHRVVLLESPESGGSVELYARLSGELTAAGFEVIHIPVAGASELYARAESVAGELHPAAVLYALASQPTPGESAPGEPALSELRISDRLLRRTFVLRFRTGAAAPPAEPAKVAVDAVEILKADLAELSVTSRAAPADRAVAPVARARDVVAPSSPTPERRGAHPELEAGLAVFQGFAGLGPAFTPALRAGTSLPASWLGDAPFGLSVLASVAAFGTRVRVDAGGAHALVGQSLGELMLLATFAPRQPIRPFLLASGGAYGVEATGGGAPIVRSRSTWSPVTGAGAGVRSDLAPGIAFALSGEAALAWSRTVVHVAGESAATAGAPLLLVSAAAVGAFLRGSLGLAARATVAATASVGLAPGLGGCAPQIVDVAELGAGAGAPGSGGSDTAASGGSGSGGGAACDAGDCACDSTSDRDGDGTPDCADGCPDQPDKLEPGLCGCTLPDDDTSEPGVASCRGLLAALVHRYAFDGTGTVVHDSAGGPDGTVVGATLSGSGSVSLAGQMSDQYVDLPNGIVSALDSATFEAWLTWYGGREWQRIFDFGDDDTELEGSRGTGGTYLFLTPRITDDGGRLVRVAYQRPSYPEVQLDATRTLPMGVLTHVAVTFDAATETLAIYLDGALESSKVVDSVPVRLSVIHDINAWLGRSQYEADPELGATFEEFRVYAEALTASQIRSSFVAGPNPTFLARPP